MRTSQSAHFGWLVWILLLGTAPGTAVSGAYASDPPGGKQEKHRDQYGDPLPEHAVARIGTVRLRHGDAITALAFSSDGKTLASASRDYTISLWDVSTGQELRRIKTGAYLDLLRFCEGSKELFGWSRFGSPLRRWDVATGKEGKPDKTRAYYLSLTPNGKRAALVAAKPGSSDRPEPPGLLEIIDTEKGPLRQFKTTGYVNSIAISPDGRVAAVGESGGLQLWDVDTGKARHWINGSIGAVGFSADSRTLFISREDKYGNSELRGIDMTTGKERATPIATSGAVMLSPDGKIATLADSTYGTLQVFNLKSGERIAELRHAGLDAFSFSPDGKTIATGGSVDSTIYLWDARTNKKRDSIGGIGDRSASRSIGPHPQPLAVSAHILADGKTLAIETGDNVLRYHDLTSGREVKRFTPWPDGSIMAVSPDGRIAAGGGKESWRTGLALYDLAKDKEMPDSERPDQAIRSVREAVFLPDGKGMLLLSWVQKPPSDRERDRLGMGMILQADYQVYRWDFASHKVRHEATKTNYQSNKLLVSPDARLVALNTGGMMGPADITFWAVPSRGSWKEAGQIESGQPIVFTPDSRFLAARIHGAEGISLWERASAAIAMTFPEKDYFAALAFSPSGRFVAQGEDSGDVVLRDILAGKEMGKLRGHRGRITSLAFARDGKTLVSGSADLTALVWDVTSLLKPAVLPRQELDAAKRKALWEQLGRVDPGKAFAAVRILVGNPKQGLAILREEVQPAAPVNVSRLIADLDSNRFDVHHRAMMELRQMGGLAVPALKKALSDNPDLDLRRRIEEVLSDIDQGKLDPEQIRLSRALLTLEFINTSDAHDLLKRLAGGTPGAWLTEEARAALKRLGKPSPG